MFPCLHTTAKKRFAQMAIHMHQQNDMAKQLKRNKAITTVSEVFFVTSDGAVKRYQRETRRGITTHKL